MRIILIFVLLFGGCESLNALLSNAPPPPPPIEYTVVRGDTLSKIAAAYDVTVEALKAENGLDSDLIEIDQVLIIPTTDAPTEPIATNRPRRNRRSGSRSTATNATTGGGGGGGAPTAGLKVPAKKACLDGPSLDELGEDEPEMMSSAGLSYAQVKSSMDVYLGRLNRCAQAEESWPEGRAQLEIVVACTGQLQSVAVSSNAGLSDSLLGCAKDLLRYTAFPAHDMPDGYSFSYPLTFSM